MFLCSSCDTAMTRVQPANVAHHAAREESLPILWCSQPSSWLFGRASGAKGFSSLCLHVMDRNHTCLEGTSKHQIRAPTPTAPKYTKSILYVFSRGRTLILLNSGSLGLSPTFSIFPQLTKTFKANFSKFGGWRVRVQILVGISAPQKVFGDPPQPRRHPPNPCAPHPTSSPQKPPPPYMRETGTMVQNGSFRRLGTTRIRRLPRGSDVKWHIPSTSLDPSQKWFSIGIYSTNRASEWLWPETQETPRNGQNVHGFQVRTPICHIVPVSRAYTPPRAPLFPTKNPPSLSPRTPPCPRENNLKISETSVK